MKMEKGITLITLVITIIVLLILSGITISLIFGYNGILAKAIFSRKNSTEKKIEEEIKLAWNGSIVGFNLNENVDNLRNDLYSKDPESEVKLEDNLVKIKYKNYETTINTVSGEFGNMNLLSSKSVFSIEEAKEKKMVFDYNATVIDEYGNKFIVPKGFKIANDSPNSVCEGIVIEDATYENSIGSQFVWIPVSKSTEDEYKIKGYVNGVLKDVTINLSRYTFNSQGKYTQQDDNTINTFREQVETEHTSKYKNAIAKDIDDFKTKTNNAGGYYIGRYEARKNSKGKLVEIATCNIYTNINQPNSVKISQEMYDENDFFETDLINSYAWDTAIVFLQEFDNRTNSNKRVYSYQNSLITGNTSLVGTTTDKICNVYDMASNCLEWTTETSLSGNPCVHRGGYFYYSGYYTSTRATNTATLANSELTFRPIMYLK